MRTQAAEQARAELAATYCVAEFEGAPDAAAKLASLKSADSWRRDEFIDKGGWAKLSGTKQSVDGAAALCAQKLMDANLAPAKPATTG